MEEGFEKKVVQNRSWKSTNLINGTIDCFTVKDRRKLNYFNYKSIFHICYSILLWGMRGMVLWMMRLSYKKEKKSPKTYSPLESD